MKVVGSHGRYLGGGFEYVFYFHPEPSGNDPISRAYFSEGLVQPPNRYRCIQYIPVFFCLTFCCHFASWVFRYIGVGCASSSLLRERWEGNNSHPMCENPLSFFDSREQLQKNGHVQPPQAQSSVLDVSYWENLVWHGWSHLVSVPKTSQAQGIHDLNGGMAIINAMTLTRTHLFMSNETEMQRSIFNRKLAHLCAICSLEIPDRSYCGSMNWMLGG